MKTWEGLLVCCDYDLETKRCYQAEAPSTWSGMRYTRTLTTAADVIDTSFQLETNGVSSAMSIGEKSVLPQVITVSRTIPH